MAPFSHTSRIMIIKEILNIILSQSFKTRGYIAVSLTAFCTCGNYPYIPCIKKCLNMGALTILELVQFFLSKVSTLKALESDL
jgi:hypothetical protein